MADSVCFHSEVLCNIRRTVSDLRFNIKVQEGQKWETLCAILNRIEDITAYLDEIKDGAKKCSF